jgi:hypothetical protein
MCLMTPQERAQKLLDQQMRPPVELAPEHPMRILHDLLPQTHEDIDLEDRIADLECEVSENESRFRSYAEDLDGACEAAREAEATPADVLLDVLVKRVEELADRMRDE